MFLYAVTHSYLELQAAIQKAENDLNGDELKKEVNFRTGTFLHWLIDYYEWLEKTCAIQLAPEERSLFSGLRYANNKLKHDPEMVQLYDRTGGFSFPVSFPLCVEAIKFVWKSIPEENSSQWINQQKNYLTYINGKEVLTVAKRALETLKKFQ